MRHSFSILRASFLLIALACPALVYADCLNPFSGLSNLGSLGASLSDSKRIVGLFSTDAAVMPTSPPPAQLTTEDAPVPDRRFDEIEAARDAADSAEADQRVPGNFHVAESGPDPDPTAPFTVDNKGVSDGPWHPADRLFPLDNNGSSADCETPMGPLSGVGVVDVTKKTQVGLAGGMVPGCMALGNRQALTIGPQISTQIGSSGQWEVGITALARSVSDGGAIPTDRYNHPVYSVGFGFRYVLPYNGNHR